MKRNKVSKCRQKIINECNLNKQQQKELGAICKNHGCKYKLIYRMMPGYSNRKKLYIKKLFEQYHKNEVIYSNFNNWFLVCNSALLVDLEDD